MQMGFYTNTHARQKRELNHWPEAFGPNRTASGHSICRYYSVPTLI